MKFIVYVLNSAACISFRLQIRIFEVISPKFVGFKNILIHKTREEIVCFQMENFCNGRRDCSEHQINKRQGLKKIMKELSEREKKIKAEDSGREWGTVLLFPSCGHEGL